MDTNLSEPAHGRPGSRGRSKRTDGRRLPHSRSVSFLDPCFTMADAGISIVLRSGLNSSDRQTDRCMYVLWRVTVHPLEGAESWTPPPCQSPATFPAPPRPAHSQGRPLTAPIRLRRRIHQREWTAHDKCLVFLFNFLQSLQLHLFRLAAAWRLRRSLQFNTLPPGYSYNENRYMLHRPTKRRRVDCYDNPLSNVQKRALVTKGLSDGIGSSPNKFKFEHLEINLAEVDRDNNV